MQLCVIYYRTFYELVHKFQRACELKKPKHDRRFKEVKASRRGSDSERITQGLVRQSHKTRTHLPAAYLHGSSRFKNSNERTDGLRCLIVETEI
jgi:hypothetical protein